LRLSNQVVEEVQKHFNDMVFDTIIQRNVKLSEAPSFGESIINCNQQRSCKLFTSSSGSYKEKQQIILWQRQ
jgi:cellulose biosynthesis protein BcsQ